MGLFDRLLGLTEAATTLDETAPLDTQVSTLSEQLRGEQETNLLLTESLVDAQLALEDIGWARLRGGAGVEFSRAGLATAAETARVMAVVNPLIRRGLALRIAYVWGQGVQISARDADDTTGGQQDLNAVLQGFLDDDGNKAALTGSQAREENERALGTDGNVFIAAPTSPLTGRVQVRTISFTQITDVITNPDDADDPWFYERKWTARTISTETGGVVSTEMRRYYPALGFRPRARPKTINGADVAWDSPVLHIAVNRLDGWTYGIGDAYSAIFWARWYKDFLEDWAKLVKALSRFAWRATAKGSRQGQVRTSFASAPTLDPLTRRPNDVGATAIMGPDTNLEAIPKSGATIDAESGRPLAAMVAAAMDVPVTMLLADPGQTGARAVAETLDAPTRLTMGMRRELWAEAYRRLTSYVIDQAVKAPQGVLRGSVRLDPVTGREVIELAAGQQRTVDIAWPGMDDADPLVRVQAIKLADDTGKMPPELVARLLMQALDVEDVDELIEAMVDDQGRFVDPGVTAGQVAMDAFNRGQDPAGAMA